MEIQDSITELLREKDALLLYLKEHGGNMTLKSSNAMISEIAEINVKIKQLMNKAE